MSVKIVFFRLVEIGSKWIKNAKYCRNIKCYAHGTLHLCDCREHKWLLWAIFVIHAKRIYWCVASYQNWSSLLLFSSMCKSKKKPRHIVFMLRKRVKLASVVLLLGSVENCHYRFGCEIFKCATEWKCHVFWLSNIVAVPLQKLCCAFKIKLLELVHGFRQSRNCPAGIFYKPTEPLQSIIANRMHCRIRLTFQIPSTKYVLLNMKLRKDFFSVCVCSGTGFECNLAIYVEWDCWSEYATNK